MRLVHFLLAIGLASSAAAVMFACSSSSSTTGAVGDGGNIVTPSGNPVRCDDEDDVGNSVGCSDSKSTCTDGHSYQLACSNDGGACSCILDNQTIKTIPPTTDIDCTDTKANQLCGWNLYVDDGSDQ